MTKGGLTFSDSPFNYKEVLMPNAGEVYKCNICGNIVYVLEGGGADLICCEEEMKPVTGDVAKNLIQKMPKPGSP
jgi:desulfoferrodoxin-like iron-binding protein